MVEAPPPAEEPPAEEAAPSAFGMEACDAPAVDAVAATGSWEAIHCPLVRVVGRPIEPAGVTMLPAMVAVTSQNTIPALKRLWQETPPGYFELPDFSPLMIGGGGRSAEGGAGGAPASALASDMHSSTSTGSSPARR